MKVTLLQKNCLYNHAQIPVTYIKYSLIQSFWNDSTLPITSVEYTDRVAILGRTSEHVHSITYRRISLLT